MLWWPMGGAASPPMQRVRVPAEGEGGIHGRTWPSVGSQNPAAGVSALVEEEGIQWGCGPVTQDEELRLQSQRGGCLQACGALLAERAGSRTGTGKVQDGPKARKRSEK